MVFLNVPMTEGLKRRIRMVAAWRGISMAELAREVLEENIQAEGQPAAAGVSYGTALDEEEGER